MTLNNQWHTYVQCDIFIGYIYGVKEANDKKKKNIDGKEKNNYEDKNIKIVILLYFFLG